MNFLYVLLLVSVVKANIFYDLSEEQYNEVKNSRNFTGKVILVTGSSHGIGEGIVKLFSALGAQVVVTARNETDVKRVAEEVEKLSPNGLKPLQVIGDVTKSEDLDNLLNKTIEKYGKIDVLVNNAGAYPDSNIHDKDFMETFDKVLNLDIRAVVELTHKAVPYLEETNGTIITMSSILGLRPLWYSMAYNCAKGAVEMMTKVLALELAPRIRVNNINPGIVDVGQLDPKFKDQVKNDVPLKRVCVPFDVAKAVVFMASTDAQFITGANLVIDGGLIYTFPNQ